MGELPSGRRRGEEPLMLDSELEGRALSWIGEEVPTVET